MDGLAPSPRRSDRPMVSQNAGRGSDGRRRGPGGFGTLEPTDDGSPSLGRRIGVLVVLAALGGAIILAAGGIGGNKPATPVVSPSPRAVTTTGRTSRPLPSPPVAAPRITTPKNPLIKARTIDLHVTVPEPGTTMTGLEVRVYRNSRLLASQKVERVGRMKINGVPLRRGTNKLTATIANAGGDGPRSATVTITVDDQPPKVSVKSPHSNTTLNARRVTITGRTEGGLSVTARNATSGSKVTGTSDAAGAYSLDVSLVPGRNVISVGTRDAAGNLGSASVVIIRGDGRLAANLVLSRDKVRLKSLPKTMNADVTVMDANGRPVEGATVSFSISPPGWQLTSNYSTTSGSDGKASWSHIALPRAGAVAGDGFVTVQVTTADGSSTTDTVHFHFLDK